jgi:cell division protein FtsB
MRWLTAAFAVSLIVLQAKLWLAEDGLRQVRELRQAVTVQTDRNRELAERNAALDAEVVDLKQGLDAAEERARTELGMVRPDETFYLIVPGADP